MNDNETAVAVQRENLRAVFQPRTMPEAIALAERVARSTICPARYQGSPDDVFVAAAHGAELGLTFLQALQSIAVINGTPSIFGDGALAVVRASSLCLWVREWIDDSDSQNLVAHCVTQRRGEPEPVERTFSEDDAERAGLLSKSGPWQSYRKRMLQMRARAFCLRDTYPDVLRGLSIHEELIGVEDATTTTTPRQQTTTVAEVERVAAEIPMPRATPQVVIDAEVDAAAAPPPAALPEPEPAVVATDDDERANPQPMSPQGDDSPRDPEPVVAEIEPETETETDEPEEIAYNVVRVTQRSARPGGAPTTWTVFLRSDREPEFATRTTVRELAVRARSFAVAQAFVSASFQQHAELGLELLDITRLGGGEES